MRTATVWIPDECTTHGAALGPVSTADTWRGFTKVTAEYDCGCKVKYTGKKVRRYRRTMRDSAVTAVLGTMLMLAMMAVLAVPMMQAVTAQKELMQAHTEATQKAAWCARNPDIGPPDCPEYGPMPGYDCRFVKPAWVCTRAGHTPTVHVNSTEIPEVNPHGIIPNP